MATLASATFREPALNSQFQIHRSQLSSAKSHGKTVLGKVFLSPAKSINTSNISMVSPAKLPSTLQQSTSLPTDYCSSTRSLEYFSSRRVIHSPSLFPNGVIFSYRYSCNYHPQRKRRNLFFNISPGCDFPAPVKNLFS